MKSTRLFLTLLLASQLAACATVRKVDDERFRFSAWNGDAMRVESIENRAAGQARRGGGPESYEVIEACPVYYSLAAREYKGWSTLGRKNVLINYVMARVEELCPDYIEQQEQKGVSSEELRKARAKIVKPGWREQRLFEIQAGVRQL